MKTHGQTAILIILTILIGACSGIRVSQDYDPSEVFSQVRTYALASHPPDEAGDIRASNPLVDERIRKAITAVMHEKGFIATDTEPDMSVGYHYSIRTKIVSTTGGPRMGIILGSSGRGNAFAFGAETDTGTYDEGILVIDFKTGKEGKALWRGTSTFPVETHIKPEKMTKKINLAVHKTLDLFPPDRK